MNGHGFLLKSLLKSLDSYITNYFNRQHHYPKALLEAHDNFLNSQDKELSTPLMLAIKHKKHSLMRDLVASSVTRLNQQSPKFGSALHIAVLNEELKFALRLIKILKKNAESSPRTCINAIDEEGNTVLHLVMKNFNVDA